MVNISINGKQLLVTITIKNYKKLLIIVIQYKLWLTINITGKFGSRYLFTSITIQKVDSSNGIISILWGCSDKKTERMIKSPAFYLVPRFGLIYPLLAWSKPYV